MSWSPVGGHIENPDDWHNIDVGRFRDTFGSGCATLLHLQMGVLPGLRRECPGALLHVRCYLANWYATAPRGWAHECADIYRQNRPFTRHYTWGNEQDLRAESGGAVGAGDGHEITVADYQAIHQWNTKFLDEWERIPDVQDAILHYPALAGGHQADDGLVGYNILRPGINRCRVLDVHLYPKIDELVNDPWEGAARIDRVIDLFPGKPLFISECGNFAVDDPRAADHLVACGYEWQARPEVVGFTYFILANPTGAADNEPNNLSRNPAILAAFQRMTPMLRDDLPEGGRVPEPPKVGQGFSRAEALIGPFDVGDDWKWPGTTRETAIIATDRGAAIWRRASNEVVVYVDDHQEIWRDWGDKAPIPGVLKKVHGL